VRATRVAIQTRVHGPWMSGSRVEAVFLRSCAWVRASRETAAGLVMKRGPPPPQPTAAREGPQPPRPGAPPPRVGPVPVVGAPPQAGAAPAGAAGGGACPAGAAGGGVAGERAVRGGGGVVGEVSPPAVSRPSRPAELAGAPVSDVRLASAAPRGVARDGGVR